MDSPMQFEAVLRITTPAIAVSLLVLGGCAQNFPRPADLPHDGSAPSGNEIFKQTFLVHGGQSLDDFNDLSVSLDGDWKFLITRIQPLVTDHRYRVVSEERLLPASGVYSADYRGPAGAKKVVRTEDGVSVFYQGVETFDEDVLQSTALTADSFFLFFLGPMALRESSGKFERLEDGLDRGKRFYRIYTVVEPGLGYSPRDEVVLWVDPETYLTYRIHITLEGYKTTQGAHVDVTFLDYEKRGAYTLPSKFVERVLGPIRIKAHSWYLTGIDINRGLTLADIEGSQYSGVAAAPAAPLR